MSIVLDDLQSGGGSVYLDDMDAANLAVPKVGSDAGTFSATETASLAITDIAVSPSESGTITLVDDSVTEVDVFTGEVGFLAATEYASTNRLVEDSGDLSVTETSDVFFGVVTIATTGEGTLSVEETAVLQVTGTVGKSASDSGDVSITDTSTLAQFDPSLSIDTTDAATISVVETAVRAIIDQAKAGSDAGTLTSTASIQLVIGGSRLLTVNDSANISVTEIVAVTKPKSATDFGSIGGAELTPEISKIQYDPGWEEDDVTWGGVLLGAKDAEPIYVKDAKFYVISRGTTPLNCVLERIAVLNGGNNYVVGLGVYPQFLASDGTVIKISLGGHDEPEGEIDWEGPYDFVVGQDEFVDFAVSGKYLAVRFETSDVVNWALQSYQVEYEFAGAH